MSKSFAALSICLAIVSTAEAKTAKTPRKPAQMQESNSQNAGTNLPDWCIALPWPISRDLSIQAISTQISTQPRMYLLQVAWGEIVRGGPDHLVAPLFRFLAGTEQDSHLRGYYKSMAYLAQNGITAEKALETWPKRVPLAQNRPDLATLCRYYEESSPNRLPQSTASRQKTTTATKASSAAPAARNKKRN